VQTKYQKFADFAPGEGDPELDSARFKLFCEQLFPKVFPRSQVGATKVDLIFSEARRIRRKSNEKAQKITFDEFFDVCVIMIAKESGGTLTVPSVIKIIMASDGPSAGTVTKADSVKFHDDKSLYTGAQADIAGVQKERKKASAGW